MRKQRKKRREAPGLLWMTWRSPRCLDVVLVESRRPSLSRSQSYESRKEAQSQYNATFPPSLELVDLVVIVHIGWFSFSNFCVAWCRWGLIMAVPHYITCSVE